MRRWATIDIADALELLSPVFESEEVIRDLCCVFIFLFQRFYKLLYILFHSSGFMFVDMIETLTQINWEVL